MFLPSPSSGKTEFEPHKAFKGFGHINFKKTLASQGAPQSGRAPTHKVISLRPIGVSDRRTASNIGRRKALNIRGTMFDNAEAHKRSKEIMDALGCTKAEADARTVVELYFRRKEKTLAERKTSLQQSTTENTQQNKTDNKVKHLAQFFLEEAHSCGNVRTALQANKTDTANLQKQKTDIKKRIDAVFSNGDCKHSAKTTLIFELSAMSSAIDEPFDFTPPGKIPPGIDPNQSSDVMQSQNELGRDWTKVGNVLRQFLHVACTPKEEALFIRCLSDAMQCFAQQAAQSGTNWDEKAPGAIAGHFLDMVYNAPDVGEKAGPGAAMPLIELAPKKLSELITSEDGKHYLTLSPCIENEDDRPHTLMSLVTGEEQKNICSNTVTCNDLEKGTGDFKKAELRLNGLIFPCIIKDEKIYVPAYKLYYYLNLTRRLDHVLTQYASDNTDNINSTKSIESISSSMGSEGDALTNIETDSATSTDDLSDKLHNARWHGAGPAASIMDLIHGRIMQSYMRADQATQSTNSPFVSHSGSIGSTRYSEDAMMIIGLLRGLEGLKILNDFRSDKALKKLPWMNDFIDAEQKYAEEKIETALTALDRIKTLTLENGGHAMGDAYARLVYDLVYIKTEYQGYDKLPGPLQRKLNALLNRLTVNLEIALNRKSLSKKLFIRYKNELKTLKDYLEKKMKDVNKDELNQAIADITHVLDNKVKHDSSITVSITMKSLIK